MTTRQQHPPSRKNCPTFVLRGKMSGFSGNDLKILANLLNEDETSSSEDDLPNPGVSKSGLFYYVVSKSVQIRLFFSTEMKLTYGKIVWS